MERPLSFVVEDNPNLSEIFAEALVEVGFAVEVIARGDTALSRLAETAPDVVILDIHLPGVGGDRILHYIRSDPRLAETRVVVASVDGGLALLLEAEADLILLKPIDYTLLRDLVGRLTPGHPHDDR